LGIGRAVDMSKTGGRVLLIPIDEMEAIVVTEGQRAKPGSAEEALWHSVADAVRELADLRTEVETLRGDNSRIVRWIRAGRERGVGI